MAEEQPTLNSLAAKISELAESLTKTLRENDVAPPTFAADSPTHYSKLTADMFTLRQQLADNLNDLWYLSQGPSESVFNYVHTCMPDAATLNILNRFDFWSAVPVDGSATYDEIAAYVSLPREVVQRVLEHATTLRLFAFVTPSSPSSSSTAIKHTSRSAALAKHGGLRALVSTIMDDAGPPMMVLGETLERYARGTTELTLNMRHTSFAHFHSGDASRGYANSWELLEQDGEGDKKGWRQRNFVEFMRYIKDIFQTEAVVHSAIDWQAAGEATVVDLGGSGGHDDVALANAFPNLTITVQDLPKAESEFDAHVPADLRPRLRFMAHDFFHPQPLSADIYLIKLILHDWPDRESVQILRGLVPAMKPGARVVFIDYVGKQEGGESGEGGGEGGETTAPAPAVEVPRSIQQMGTATDMRMMALFNARERPVGAWKELFRAADERFDVVRVEANPMSFIVVIEAVWRG